jgi:hypothetical protein
MSYTYQRAVTSYNLARRETSIVAPLGVATATPTTVHNQLTGRDATGAHPAAAITESATQVFVTPAQKTAIDTAVQPGDLGTPDVAGFTTGDPAKLAGIAAGANKYSHPNHTGDVTSVGDGAQTIAARAVTAAKLFALATARFLGRIAAESGDVEQLTAAQLAGALTHNDIGTRTAADSHPAAAITPPPWYDASAAFTAGAGTINYANGLAQSIDLTAGTAIDITAISNFPTGNGARMLLLFKSSGKIASLAGPASSVLNGTFPGTAGKPLRVLVSQQAGDVGLYLKHYPEEAS